jgi:sulfatase modifying factor 1
MSQTREITANYVEPLPVDHEQRAGYGVGLFVGINAFDDPCLQPLRYAVHDAVDLTHAFVVSLALLAPRFVCLAIDQDPSDEACGRRLEELLRLGVRREMPLRATLLRELVNCCELPATRLVTSFSTHGFGKHLLPKDGYQSDRLRQRTGISVSDVEELLNDSPAPLKIDYTDACRNEPVLRVPGQKSAAVEPFDVSAGQAEGCANLRSCSRGQVSYEFEELRNGVSTHYLLRALGVRGRPEADPVEEVATPDAGGVVTLHSVMQYLLSSTSRFLMTMASDPSYEWLRKAGARQTPHLSAPESLRRLPLGRAAVDWATTSATEGRGQREQPPAASIGVTPAPAPNPMGAALHRIDGWLTGLPEAHRGDLAALRKQLEVVPARLTRLELATLSSIHEEAMLSKDATRVAHLREYLLAADRVLSKDLGQRSVWLRFGQAALELNDSDLAWRAGRMLLAFGADDDGDAEELRLLSKLDRGGWLKERRPSVLAAEAAREAAERLARESAEKALREAEAARQAESAREAAERSRREKLARDGMLVYPAPKELTLSSGVTMRFARIAPGEFLMGSPSGEEGRDADEGPQHKVRLTKGFAMGVTAVTQAQWEAVMGTNPSRFKGPTLPVEQVSWFDAVEYCNRLTEWLNRNGGPYRKPYYAIDGERVTAGVGTGFRLPTEAEWEYACRAGTQTQFHFGPTISLKQAHYYPDESVPWENRAGNTKPVGSFPANAWGLHDMHGNTLEWCWDWYGEKEYATRSSSSVTQDPTGPLSGSARVVRGGSWSYDPWFLRSAFRDGYSPSVRIISFGFRLCLDSG